MFATYQLNDLSIEDLADLSNRKRTKLSQSDLLNAALYLRSLRGLSPPGAKAAQPINHKLSLLESGRKAESIASDLFQNSIAPYVNPDGSVDAGAMMTNWFPDYDATAFISHARADKELALAFAGWLMVEFKIVAFIDSCVWLHANDLLNKIDKTWCFKEETNTYAYESRNISTAHVHMMLATALAKMMDRCECVFFLNTENSVSSKSIEQMVSGENECTHSPWLFHEISMMKLLRRKEKNKHRAKVTHFAEAAEKRASAMVPDFKYPADLEGIPALDSEVLNAWL